MELPRNKKLLLVDFENRQNIDMSLLDDTYSAIIFVGASQTNPKVFTKKSTAHRFKRVDFQKIEFPGKNALDFHIACHLGRILETAPQTECFVLSGDKGFDPLLAHLNKLGLRCKRLESMEELLPPHTEIRISAPAVPGTSADMDYCAHCRRSNTIEHYGGRWCANCGRFTVPGDPALLPKHHNHSELNQRARPARIALVKCGWCYQMVAMGGGIYDDGEWMCGGCVAGYIR